MEIELPIWRPTPERIFKMKLKLIDMHTERDGSKTYEETEYFPPGGLLHIWDDILYLASVWVKESALNDCTIKMHRNHDGYPTARVRHKDVVKTLLGVVLSNSHPLKLENVKGKF